VTLSEIVHPLGRKALSGVPTAALPDTILKWYRRLVACKFDGSWARRAPGRLPIGKEIKELIVRMAKENRSWSYDRIVGALTNLGHQVSDQTVGNVLRRRRLLRRFRVGSRQSSHRGGLSCADQPDYRRYGMTGSIACAQRGERRHPVG
jgi:hypothetical protein